MVILVIAGVAAYTMATVKTYAYSCTSPGWLVLSSMGLVAQIALSIAACIVHGKVRLVQNQSHCEQSTPSQLFAKLPLPRPMTLSWNRDFGRPERIWLLWCLLAASPPLLR